LNNNKTHFNYLSIYFFLHYIFLKYSKLTQASEGYFADNTPVQPIIICKESPVQRNFLSFITNDYPMLWNFCDEIDKGESDQVGASYQNQGQSSNEPIPDKQASNGPGRSEEAVHGGRPNAVRPPQPVPY
jgi:hypothetical protein